MAYRIHHLNAGTLCPRCARLVNGQGGWFQPGRLICHVLLVETDDGLVLVDTGLGRGDLREPGHLSPLFRRAARPLLKAEETAWHQVRALGFRPEDVRHIVLTHLDLDHAGGLTDFPQAQVHVHALEHRHAVQRLELMRAARTAPAQWRADTPWRCHEVGLEGERWRGFDAVRALGPRLDDVLLIPLPGHTRGHCGVAVRRAEGWLLHAGDAFFHHRQMQGRPAPLGLRLFEWRGDEDRPARRANQQRLAALARSQPDVRVINSHDPHFLPAPASAPAVPAP